MPRSPKKLRTPVLAGSDQGFALIITSLLLAIVLGLGVTLTTFTISSRQTAKTVEGAFDAVQLADAGVQKALYCLRAASGTNCGGGSNFGGAYIGETNVTVGSGKFTTVVGSGANTKTVSSTGTTAAGSTKTVLVDVTTIPPTDSPEFSYALQSGSGGAHLENNASIQGTIYSNGDIDCQSQSSAISVTGDAYSSKDGGKFEKCRTAAHVHADKILNAQVDGNAYYKNDPTDIAGTTVIGAKYPNSATPAVAPMPILNLQFWRDSAEAGGTISGDHSPADNSELGPIKITGDLIMDSNVDVTINGPVWVMGDIATGNNSTFTLASSFGPYSTVILADDPSDTLNRGKIDITNNTGIYGSGNPTSHILFASTNSSSSNSTPALSVANNASGAIFYALNGTMRLRNGAGAKSISGYRLFLDQNAVVNYIQSEYAGLFSNSPGASWGIKEGTWRVAR